MNAFQNQYCPELPIHCIQKYIHHKCDVCLTNDQKYRKNISNSEQFAQHLEKRREKNGWCSYFGVTEPRTLQNICTPKVLFFFYCAEEWRKHTLFCENLKTVSRSIYSKFVHYTCNLPLYLHVVNVNSSECICRSFSICVCNIVYMRFPPVYYFTHTQCHTPR